MTKPDHEAAPTREQVVAYLKSLDDMGWLQIWADAGERGSESVIRLMQEKRAAVEKAERFERDWYAAKSEFGDALGKALDEKRNAIARAEAAERKVEAWSRIVWLQGILGGSAEAQTLAERLPTELRSRYTSGDPNEGRAKP